MILTVTFNAALDRVIFVDSIRPGETAYAVKMVDSVGGKGYDTSVVLQGLGAPNLALGFAAGQIGRDLARLLDRYGVRYEIAWVAGETRIAHIIIETAARRITRLNTPGYDLTRQDVRRFFDLVAQRLPGVDWVVAAGTLPPGLPSDSYRTLVELAARAGARTLVDTRGEPALQALPASPAVLKMNHHEFNETFHLPGYTPQELCEPAGAIVRRYGLSALVLTCGPAGILAALPQGSLWAHTPPLEEVNAAGAGDAVSAALAWRFSLGDAWEQALRWAAAASAAVVLTEPTAECRWQDVERIYPSAAVEWMDA
jgi:1-phosphofructokinase family hexose kinase